jgi:hypothetical protein
MTALAKNLTEFKQKTSLLKNSMIELQEYRNEQAKKLKTRFDIFLKSTIDKYGSIDKIKNIESAPIDSQRDIDIINKMIELKIFITIPVLQEDKNKTEGISHFYTLGLWYYWGLPEIVIKFDKPIQQNAEFINIIVNIIHDKLYYMYKDKILINSQHSNGIDFIQDINRIDFNEGPKEITIELEEFDVYFRMRRIEENQYMDIKTYYMLWFYMYYMDAILDKKNLPKLYPVYQIKLTEEKYIGLSKKIMNKLLEVTLNQMSVSDYVSNNDTNDTDSSDTDSITSIDDDLNNESSSRVEKLDE